MSCFDFSAVAIKASEFGHVTPLYHRQRDPLPIVQQAGWDPGPVWKGAENFAPIGIRSPVRPARSELLRYPGALCIVLLREKTTKSQANKCT